MYYNCIILLLLYTLISLQHVLTPNSFFYWLHLQSICARKTAFFFCEFDGKNFIVMRFCVQEFESGKLMKAVAIIRAL